MKRTVLYVDTEETRISRVLDIITDTLEYSDAIHVKSLNEAYRVLLERTIDIFVINITPSESKGTYMEGVHFISCIREIPRYFLAPVIILSSLQDPRMYAYEHLHCLGYLSKTFPREKMVELLKKASHYKAKRPEDRTIVFQKNRAMYPIPVKDIVYMVRENGITRVHLADGEILEMPYVSYSRLLGNADDNRLFMCNRSTIVNREYVYAVDPTNCFVMLRGERGMLDIGLKYRMGINLEFSDQYKTGYGQKKQEK